MINQYDIPSEIANSVEQLAFSDAIQWRFLKQTVNPKHINFQKQDHSFETFQVMERYSYSAILFPFGTQSKIKEIDNTISPITKYIALEIISKPVEIKRIMINMHANCYGDLS